MNDDISELQDSFWEVLITIKPEMCHQVMISVRRRLELGVQSGGQCFENLCIIAKLRVRQGGTPIRISGALSAKTTFFLKKRVCVPRA